VTNRSIRSAINLVNNYICPFSLLMKKEAKELYYYQLIHIDLSKNAKLTRDTTHPGYAHIDAERILLTENNESNGNTPTAFKPAELKHTPRSCCAPCVATPSTRERELALTAGALLVLALVLRSIGHCTCHFIVLYFIILAFRIPLRPSVPWTRDRAASSPPFIYVP